MEKTKDSLAQPLPQRTYGSIIYWLSIAASMICIIAPVIAVASPNRNVMNPHFLFFTIWEGKNPEAVWQEVAGGFPGGHFWLNNLTSGDGFTQVGLVLGCLCAGVALIGTSIAFIWREPRVYGWALVSLGLATLIILAALGIYHV